MLVNNRELYINPSEDKERLEKMPVLASVNKNIFNLRHKEKIDELAKDPVVKVLIDKLLDTEDENHDLYIFYFNHALSIIGNIAEYASYGLLNISLEKTKLAEFLKEFIKDDYSEENKNTIKSILDELTLDDITYLFLSAVVAVNDKQALSYLAYNIFADGEEVDNLMEKLMNAKKAVDKKKEMLTEMTFEMSENETNENIYIRFIDSITYIYDNDFKKQIEAITPDELAGAKIRKIFECVAEAIEETLKETSEDEDQSDTGKGPYQKK